MSRTIIGRTVGAFVIDEPENGEVTFYLEQDYGSNCYGDVGLFYRNANADFPGDPLFCYISEVPGGCISNAHPEYRDYCYTFDDVLRICEGDRGMAEYVLELACGQSIEAIWDEVKDGRTTCVDAN